MSKTNDQANFFGSKVVPPGSNKNSKKKAPIWQFYEQSDKAKSKAVCKLCGGAFSLGSEQPKFQTTTGFFLIMRNNYFLFMKILQMAIINGNKTYLFKFENFLQFEYKGYFKD